MDEMQALEANGTREIVRLLDGKKNCWQQMVFTMIYKSNGSIDRYKATLVAQGFTQTQRLDYEETLALIANKLNSIRVLLSLVVNLDWKLHQLDIKNPFLSGELEEEIYMRIQLGFETENTKGKVCQLKKSLYGLKQSPEAWFKRFSDTRIQIRTCKPYPIHKT